MATKKPAPAADKQDAARKQKIREQVSRGLKGGRYQVADSGELTKVTKEPGNEVA
ncbi:hypothetical protein [Bowmanella dokdonensis]|uniref:Uncharacterized protein n=1 Tax=Bowmanella dokdonensis TaxID=751969 RepID=A0A939DL79_9ALTE|nr:hypothetical protein [Bowmanella dokdonensis]MBN7824778.1 hypothetical protein [Bowmanella dokdonensis]